ncbi:MAG: PmoA family protein [Gemmataceae bacterium]|nr:PmoA family protein [Gemmataceae bacterium]
MRRSWLLAAAVLAPSVARADEVTITAAADAVEFKAGQQVVAKYHVAPTVAKPYLYPILAPGGVPVTRGWPMDPTRKGETNDHPHQKSAWFCHGDVIPEGIELKTKSANKGDEGVDFWSEAKDKDGKPRHGTIACVKVGAPHRLDKNYGKITTWNEWRTPDGVKILDEERTITLIDLSEGRLFVFDIVLKATVCPIAFGDTKEGSFGVRVRDEIRMNKEKDRLGGDGVLTNDAGKAGEKEVWGQAANWCDYSGKLDGTTAGIAVMSHPANPPAAWHARGYGLLAANPFGRDRAGFPSQKGKTDLVKIEKGKELKLSYAIYAHAGDAKTGKVAEAYDGFRK